VQGSAFEGDGDEVGVSVPSPDLKLWTVSDGRDQAAGKRVKSELAGLGSMEYWTVCSGERPRPTFAVHVNVSSKISKPSPLEIIRSSRRGFCSIFGTRPILLAFFLFFNLFSNRSSEKSGHRLRALPWGRTTSNYREFALRGRLGTWRVAPGCPISDRQIGGVRRPCGTFMLF